jgi:hypothetical protein
MLQLNGTAGYEILLIWLHPVRFLLPQDPGFFVEGYGYLSGEDDGEGYGFEEK